MSASTASPDRPAAIVSLADHRRHQWSGADLSWEEDSLAGAGAMIAGRPDVALRHLDAAASMAATAFAGDDPRTAAALTNLARCTRSLAGAAAASTLFESAGQAWDAARGWPDRVRVGDGVLSAPQCRRLLDEGHRFALALAVRRPLLLPCGLERWRALHRSDQALRRRLLGAVFLSTFRLAESACGTTAGPVAETPPLMPDRKSNQEERKVAK